MTKTRRDPSGAFAGQGAVNQHDGALPVYLCNGCDREVVWAESKRTGRKYLANVSRGYRDQRFYIGAFVHKCEPIRLYSRINPYGSNGDPIVVLSEALEAALALPVTSDLLDVLVELLDGALADAGSEQDGAARDALHGSLFGAHEREQEAAAFKAGL